MTIADPVGGRTQPERNRQVDRRGGLADSAFLIGYNDQPPHNRLHLPTVSNIVLPSLSLSRALTGGGCSLSLRCGQRQGRAGRTLVIIVLAVGENKRVRSSNQQVSSRHSAAFHAGGGPRSLRSKPSYS